MKKKKDYLFRKIENIFETKQKGKLLDLGCGDGKTSKMFHDKGFYVIAADMDNERFQYKEEIDFQKINLSNRLPFADNAFDYIVLMEVIEHIYNPDYVVSEINRVLKLNGILILSTPNILNIGSRLRFLFEGSFDFFREPILDYSRCFPMAIQNMHVIPWRYHEIEYLLFKNNLNILKIHTDIEKRNLKLLYFLLKPLLQLQCSQKCRRTKKIGEGINYRRINKIVLSKQILCGRHLILEAKNNS